MSLNVRSIAHSGFVRFDATLLQQRGALYPHVEISSPPASLIVRPKSTAAIICRAHHLDFHLARDRGDFAIGADREVIERAQRRPVLIVKSHATRHLISFFHLLSALARRPLADVRRAPGRGLTGLRGALHGLSLEVAGARDGLPFDRLVIANQLIRSQRTTIIFRHLGFSLMSRWQARIGDLD
jgi:hypothetical protein